MPLFVDTGFFVALQNEDDNFHSKAMDIAADLLHGRREKLYCSDYILDEAITAVRARTKDYNKAIRTGNIIVNSKDIEMVKVSDDIIKKALESYKQYRDKKLSFTDWTSYHLIKKKNFLGIVSPDHEFEQVGIYTEK